MRKLFTLLALLYAITGIGQTYNNEWINPAQTYYKFKVGSTGLYRIPQSTIAAIGLSAVPVQQFQLWRNGKEVPLYITATTGALPAGGYIEFWGLRNDGKADLPLYRDPSYQHTDKLALISDTAVYFLTVNTASANQRIPDAANNVASNTLPVEPYFPYTYGKYFRNTLNPGFAAVVGEYVYSGSYDKGEFWCSGNFGPAVGITDAASNLYPYASGTSASLRYGTVGNALNARTIQAKINGSLLKDTTCDYFNDLVTSTSFPQSLISSGTANVEFDNTSAVSSDRATMSFYEITYSRQFNFGGQSSFTFVLPGRSQGYYLQIANFNNGAVAPVLYDYTYQLRYTGDISTPGVVKFALPAASQDRQLVLVSEDPTAYNTVASASFQVKNFIDFTNTANQGNYLIISNKLLFGGDNPVDAYRQYRSSAAGGAYNAKVIDIDELVDQFAFGIKKHPLSIKNFLRYARAKFAAAPKDVLLIGRGTTYYEYRMSHDSDPITDQLNLVPTFGWPASDNLLASADGASPVALTNIGRLSVVSTDEVDNYLQKVKEYELAQQTNPNTIDGRAWMKNILHLTGASDNSLGPLLCSYMDSYAQMIQDTLVGGNVTEFCKSSTSSVEVIADNLIASLFQTGLGLVTYFGHSSSTTLEYNLDDPQNYNNQGKYPIFSVNGCNAGNFFSWDAQRFTYSLSLSEKFTLAKERGGVAYLASTHYGIVNYLNIYLTSLYNLTSSTDYSAPIGQLLRDACGKMVQITGSDDYYARMHAEEMTLHGDPALAFSHEPIPDYDIEASQVKVSPQFISTSSNKYSLGVKLYNLGKAIADSVTVQITQQYPNNTTATLYRKKIPGIRYMDSISMDVPVIASRDKGLNKLTVTIDPDNVVTEVTKANNSVTIQFYVYEDEMTPVYPYNYSIVNNNSIKFYASTSNPFSPLKQYVMQIDTTASFNSPLMVSRTISSAGGTVEFDPGVTFKDSTVYYWRTAYVPATGLDYLWNQYSFIYMKGYGDGFNQSHYFQHLESTSQRIALNTDRVWRYGTNYNNLFVRNAVYPTSGTTDDQFEVTVNGQTYIESACVGLSLIFNVFDRQSFVPWINVDVNGNSLYRYGSGSASCKPTRNYNFEFSFMDPVNRKKMMDFMDSIPAGSYVVVRNNVSPTQSVNLYANDWKKDTTLYGSGNSLYHKLVNAGLVTLDSFYYPRVFSFVYKKGDPAYVTKTQFSVGVYDRISMSVDCPTPDTLGYTTSPVFGPAKAWKQVHWRGSSMESVPGDNPTLQVIGLDATGAGTVLFNLDKSTQDFDISSVSATQYPNIRLMLRNPDSINLTPYQLKYWRIDYSPVPEGGLIPNIYFKSKNPTQAVDSLNVGEIFSFGIAFKNISQVPFDSLKIKLYILDRNNVTHNIVLPKGKPLIVGDSIHLDYQIDTKDYAGLNTLYVDFNPDNDQPEQYLFNNFLYRNFYVKPDSTGPLLDVTFDNVHILNRDIVSAKPHIQIKLKDESKYLLLNDTSDVLVQLQYPNGTLKSYRFDGDTLRFTPAVSGSNNTATVDFNPQFLNQVNPDGDEYQLIVSGKDKSNNISGSTQYKVTFRVISKPMISNLLNYPNPFTTSTAFVFTITGSEVPQNMKIQILTITGKIVREITKAELGPLHIGRNITEFKWNGTDQYGDRLANGVYIYRFVTQLNGIKMDKYTGDGDNTDKFFNNGYGKMYLMK